MNRAKKQIKTLGGAVSLYLVMFAIVVFAVVATGYAGLVLSEINKTINKDLAQSAYDSALAGIEDAKLAIIQYNNCIGKDANQVIDGQALTCGQIKELMSQANADGACDTVGRILGRIPVDAEEQQEIMIKETSTSGTSADQMLQAYTCVKIGTSLPDYRSTLSSTDTIRVIPLSSNATNSLTGVRISWYSDKNGTTYKYTLNGGANSTLKGLSSYEDNATPPMITAQLIQTDQYFSLRDFDWTKVTSVSGARDCTDAQNGSESYCTDRGTLFLVPRAGDGVYHINSTGFTKANDKSQTNTAYNVRCDQGGEFVCSVTIGLPRPVQNIQYDSQDADNIRNGATAFLILTLPYGQPATDFSVELCTDTDGGKTNGDCQTVDAASGKTVAAIANFEGVQAAVDSTGRANDLFSRVEARVELMDIYFPFPTYALQLSDSDETINKNFYVTRDCKNKDDGGAWVYCSTNSGSAPTPD